MYDMIPAYIWIPAAIVLWPLAVMAVTVRASKRYWADREASDPAVVTASGHPSSRYVRACKQEVVR